MQKRTSARKHSLLPAAGPPKANQNYQPEIQRKSTCLNSSDGGARTIKTVFMSSLGLSVAGVEVSLPPQPMKPKQTSLQSFIFV